MTDILLALLTALASYLIGGIPFGYLIARARGVNLFQQGSGNIGATNVARVLGHKYGIVAFVLDFAKGALPVVLALNLASGYAIVPSPPELGVIAGLAAVLGHLFPVYLRFRGGKGVATAAGVVVVLVPLAALTSLVVWVGVVSATRYVSAGSLAAAVALCVVHVLTTPPPFETENSILTVFCFVAATLVFVRHRGNIARLLQGNENRLKEEGLMQPISRVIHVLALGLWFGMAIFFSFVVGLTLFHQMDDLALNSSKHPWFEVPAKFSLADEQIKGPKEYASRTAGHMISPMFNWYFLIQGVCGFLAVATAWSWQYVEPGRKVHGRRIMVLILALATVILGWPLEQHVSTLRTVRHEKMDAYFESGPDVEGIVKQAALDARAEFGLYHTYSLFLNFATIALVSVSMGMAAYLPVSRSTEAKLS